MFTKFRKIQKKTSEMECLFNEKIDSIDRSPPINSGKFLGQSNVWILGQMSSTIIILTSRATLLLLTSNKSGITQPAVTCSKLTIETLEQGVKYVQS